MRYRHMARKGLLAAIAVCLLLQPIGQPNAAIDYQQRYAMDLQAIESSRLGMKSNIEFLVAHPEIFPASKVNGDEHRLNREQRMLVWQSWHNFLDHVLFFDSMGEMYSGIYRNAKDKKSKQKTFIAAYACFLAQYRFAMDYIDRMENSPGMHVILNEAVPELGLEQGAYSKLKFRFLNVIRGAEFSRLNVLYLHYKQDGESSLQSSIEEDIGKIWKAGKGKGPLLTAQNALKIISDLGFTAWFPVQKNVSELMGNIKVWRPGISLISHRQIEELKDLLRPGDILLQRREWYATNIGIPGFWTHAALYIGTAEERTRYFSDPDLTEWFIAQGGKGGTIDSLLENRYKQKYPLSITPRENGHLPRVLEAIAEGVSFTTIEHSAAADSLVVLRPNLPLKNIAQALIKAFHYSGRPYDFNFDFRTDSEFVCSELVYKAYEP